MKGYQTDFLTGEEKGIDNVVKDDIKDKDYATGRKIDLNSPEEPVRQDIEKWLVEELGYSKDNLDIEYSLRIGSKRPRPDIIIFNRSRYSNPNQFKDVIGLVETKASSIPDAEDQLFSYMAVCPSCEWGVAATADTKQFYRRMPDGTMNRIHAIPPSGISINHSVRLKKSDLKPSVNLKLHFKAILHHLHSNSNLQARSRLCAEIAKILLCKIYDEKLNMDTPLFQVAINKSGSEIKKDIEEKLWSPVMAELEPSGIFQSGENLLLDAESIEYVIGQIERLNLSETDCDVIGAAFEVFAEGPFAGEKGQFFTPRIAIKNAIKMLDPQYSKMIIDPACGSGGFLIYAMEYIWNKIEKSNLDTERTKKIAPSFLFGIDKDIDLVKLARAYMTLVGDGSTNIVDADSLRPFDSWDAKAQAMLSDGNGKRKKFDFVFTNPPFGAEIKIKHKNILEKYDLGYRWDKPKNSSTWIKSSETKHTDPQILFLELCVSLLKQGGRMCVVLPESVLGNVGEGYVRQWLMENTTILAIWDCPSLLFQPHTSTKTCILFIEKSNTLNQPIMMSVISKCGHDARGAEIKSDNGELVEDFSKALSDWENRPSKNQTNSKEWKGEISILLSRKDAIEKSILVPRIHQIEHGLGLTTKKLGELEHECLISIKTVTCGVRQKEYDDKEAIPFIRTSDLGNMELLRSHHKVSAEIYRREKSSQDISDLDILIVKDGGHRIGEPVILFEDDINIVVQGHFYKIRVLNKSLLNPFFLVYSLKKSQPFISASAVIQATLGSITIDRLREIPIYYPTSSEQIIIADKIHKILSQVKSSRKEFNELYNLEI